jgi:hypothetical protein
MSTRKTPPWLLLVFSLSAKHASLRVELWRRLRRYGAFALKSSGYILPNNAANEERFQWLAQQVRRVKGQATIVRAEAFDRFPSEDLVDQFVRQCSREYAALAREVQRALQKLAPAQAQRTRLRKSWSSSWQS